MQNMKADNKLKWVLIFSIYDQSELLKIITDMKIYVTVKNEIILKAIN